MFRITSLELWDELEEKIVKVSKGVKGVDEILSEKLATLPRHFNGNLAKGNQYVCIEHIETIVDNVGRENYYRDRKYTQDEADMVLDLSESLKTLLKVLRAEYRDKVISSASQKDEKKEDRLPNINTDKVMNLYGGK